MKIPVSVFSTLLFLSLGEAAAAAVARPHLLLPTQTIPLPAGLNPYDVAISGDWLLVGGTSEADSDPNTYIALDRVFLYHRAANGTWSPGTLLLSEQSPSYFTKVAINSQIIAIEVPSGTHIFENTSAGWVERPFDGAVGSLAEYLDIDGTTVLIGSGHCGSNALVFDRTSAGHWAKSGELHATQSPCSDSQVGNEHVAVSGNTALLWDALAPRSSRARLFERAPGPTWTPTTILPPPPLDEPDNYFGNAMDLSGSLALISDWNRGTNVYRRSGSTWSRTGYMTFLDGFSQLATKLRIDNPYIAQSSYNSTLDVQVLHIFRERADQGFDEVAQLTTPDGTAIINEFDISGSSVVASIYNKVFLYQLPQPLNPVLPTQQYDFESGSTAQWAILPGSSFSVVSGGTGHVYRQSSTAGDAAAMHPDDNTAQSIQADITPTAFNGNDRWYGLVTRYTDESNYYYVTWRNPGRLVLKRKLNGVITELANTVLGVTLNQQRRVRLESNGNRHSVMIDDYEYLHAFDDALPHGRAGLRTYRASADFDNVLVSAAPRAQFVREEINQTSTAFDVVDGAWAIEHDDVYDQDLYRQTSAGGDARTVAWPVSDDQIVQTFVRVDAFSPAPRGEAWVGLMARYKDPANYYYVSLRSSNQISLRRLVNGQATVLRTAALPVAAGSNFLVRLDVVGDRLRVYVDRTFVFETVDSTFAEGKAGLVSYRAAASFGAFSAYQP